MDIILLQRIEKLGSIGDVVTVKDGYARNFLLPQKKALRANEANKKVFEANRDRLEKENAERRTEAEKAGVFSLPRSRRRSPHVSGGKPDSQSNSRCPDRLVRRRVVGAPGA